MIAKVLVAIVLGCGATLVPGPGVAKAQEEAPSGATDAQANSPTTEAARTHFQRGVDYYRDGDYERALAEFKHAYERTPNYKLLYNLGQLGVQLHDYVAAQRYFQQYLEQGAENIDLDRKAEVDFELVKLQGRIGSLTLASNAGDATFSIDGVNVAAGAAGGPVLVSAGTHTVVAQAPGRDRITRVVDVTGGASRLVRMELPVTRSKPRARTSSTDEAGSIDAVLWCGAGTGALAMGAGVMAALTSRDERAYQAELVKRTTREQLDALRGRAKNKALVTDVLLAATVGAAITTLVVALTGGGNDAEPAPRSGPRADAELRVGFASLQLQGQF